MLTYTCPLLSSCGSVCTRTAKEYCPEYWGFADYTQFETYSPPNLYSIAGLNEPPLQAKRVSSPYFTFSNDGLANSNILTLSSPELNSVFQLTPATRLGLFNKQRIVSYYDLTSNASISSVIKKFSVKDTKSGKVVSCNIYDAYNQILPGASGYAEILARPYVGGYSGTQYTVPVKTTFSGSSAGTDCN
ncbi:MAG: hypothetical protein IT292_00885 [Deltaproteobacteria bacterium]|nr:hypothetical protein [Deltaproteobacteria bacterium]